MSNVTKGFEVTLADGTKQVVTTPKEVQALVKGATIKNILAGKVEGVVILEDAVSEPVDEPTTEPSDNAEPVEETTQPSTNTDTKADKNPASNDVEYPERGSFADAKAMKKFYKPLSDEQIYEWCELEGVTWKANEHASINRMRAIMALKAVYGFGPAPSEGKKSKSKYAGLSTEELVQMALDNDIEVPDDKGDHRILRMYTIMALRKAGLIS